MDRRTMKRLRKMERHLTSHRTVATAQSVLTEADDIAARALRACDRTGDDLAADALDQATRLVRAATDLLAVNA